MGIERQIQTAREQAAAPREQAETARKLIAFSPEKLGSIPKSHSLLKILFVPQTYGIQRLQIYSSVCIGTGMLCRLHSIGMFSSNAFRVRSTLERRIDCVQAGLKNASGKIFLAWEASIPFRRMMSFKHVASPSTIL